MIERPRLPWQDVVGQLPRKVLHPDEFQEVSLGQAAAAHPDEVHARHSGPFCSRAGPAVCGCPPLKSALRFHHAVE